MYPIIEKILRFRFLILTLMSNVYGQGGGPIAEEYTRQAEILRRNVKPDIAILFNWNTSHSLYEWWMS